MGAIRFHDLLAGLIAIFLLVALATMAILGRERPPELINAFTATLGWVLGAGVQRANGALTGRRNDDG